IFALLGYLSSRSIPFDAASDPELKLRWRPYQKTKHTLAIAKSDRIVFKCIMAISWFRFLGAANLTQYPNFTNVYLNGTESD
ncbi:MFS transporter, partial [Vibrio parahaemolyticus]|nr:MFS transporter [Vibrio parahaemolyticus]